MSEEMVRDLVGALHTASERDDTLLASRQDSEDTLFDAAYEVAAAMGGEPATPEEIAEAARRYAREEWASWTLVCAEDGGAVQP